MKQRVILAVIVMMAVIVPPALGQSLQQRIEAVRERRAQEAAAAQQAAERMNVSVRLRDVIENVNIESARVRTAFEWWSNVTGIPLVVDWNALEMEGIDSEAFISLRLRAVPAGQCLAMLMKLAAPQDVELLYEATPWYLEVLTKRQANRRLITRVYEVGDLLMEIPHFTSAPQFDLSEVLSSDSAGSGSGRSGGGRGIFGDRQDQTTMTTTTREERGEELASLIRDTVEPDLWQDWGGAEGASIRYFQGRLIIRAPLYVHRQIGIPSISPMSSWEAGGAHLAGSASRASPHQANVHPQTRPMPAAAAYHSVSGVRHNDRQTSGVR